jgi:hypothetical protein
MTNIPHDNVENILLEDNFSIVDMFTDPDAPETTVLLIVHDLHPETEVKVRLYLTRMTVTIQ